MADTKIKLSIRIPPEPSDDDLIFVQQLGVDCVYTWVPPKQTDGESLRALRRRVESFGLTLCNVGCYELGKSDRIHLGLPGRDEMIAAFADFLRALGEAGIDTTTFTFEPSNVWSTEAETTRGGAVTRAVDMAVLLQEGCSHGRKYAVDEIWDNFTYFMKAIIPVAEETGVRLALHPNDPPVPEIAGIPCLIHSFEDYERAFAIADSKQLGMEFCTGCWLEGGADFGDMFQAIRRFADTGKIFIVHFRNVSGPLPHFAETFIDDGYQDMAEVMQAFVDSGFEGTMVLDHTPAMIDTAGPGAPTAYAIGFIKGLLAGVDR
jgi:mannonate dehydratase